jgi:hypothetical protein
MRSQKIAILKNIAAGRASVESLLDLEPGKKYNFIRKSPITRDEISNNNGQIETDLLPTELFECVENSKVYQVKDLSAICEKKQGSAGHIMWCELSDRTDVMAISKIQIWEVNDNDLKKITTA